MNESGTEITNVVNIHYLFWRFSVPTKSHGHIYECASKRGTITNNRHASSMDFVLFLLLLKGPCTHYLNIADTVDTTVFERIFVLNVYIP